MKKSASRYDIILYYIRNVSVCQSNLPTPHAFFCQSFDPAKPCRICRPSEDTGSRTAPCAKRIIPCKERTFRDDGMHRPTADSALGERRYIVHRYERFAFAPPDSHGDAFGLPQSPCQPLEHTSAPSVDRKIAHPLRQIGGRRLSELAVGTDKRDAHFSAV